MTIFLTSVMWGCETRNCSQERRHQQMMLLSVLYACRDGGISDQECFEKEITLDRNDRKWWCNNVL